MSSAPTFPKITEDAFQTSCTTAQTKVAQFFKDFVQSFRGAPDERGLTDQLLLALKKAMPTLHIQAYSQREENTLGTDYSLRFTTIKGKRGVHIQAKSIKEGIIIDFAYRNDLAEQAGLLKHNVDYANQQELEGAKHLGGYIIYSGDVFMFIPIDDVDHEIDVVMAKHGGKLNTDALKEMGKYYWEKRNDYPLINMYTMVLA